MASRAVWKGQLRLSLVAIPVEVHPATQSGARISFRQIHGPSGKPVRYTKSVPGIGPVKTEGEGPGRGPLAGTAGRASYDSYKGMFLLEGDGAVPATIHQQDFIGAPPNETVAQKLTYNLRTGQVGGQFNKIEWNQFDVSRPPATTQQR